MKTKKKLRPEGFGEFYNRLEAVLESVGYSKDPDLLPRIKNSSFYHKLRRKFYAGSLPPTVAGIDERYDIVKKNYKLLYMGFWSAYPVLFTAEECSDLEKKGFSTFIKRYNRDIYEFFPYTAKCILKITIWPKIEIHSYPFGYLLIVFPKGIDSNASLIEQWKSEWTNLPGFEKFCVLPPLITDLKTKKIITPFSKTKLTKYPPSLKELSKALFNEKYSLQETEVR